MSEFSIHRVDKSQAQDPEQLGTKPKFWFRLQDRQLLFKADDRDTGEDWAEVIACHLCGLLGLPHVEYELATECDGERELRPGVICENMAPPPISLFLGNQLLQAVDSRYPGGERSKFKVPEHSVEAVCDVVSTLELPAAAWMAGVPTGIESALDVFTGYVMLDAWIANPDRHHENWAALWDGEAMRLAPTFDHAAALARNLRDSERQERLTTKDQNRTVLAFVQKGRSAFFGSPAGPRPLELREAFFAFARHAGPSARSWQKRLAAVNADAIQAILDKVPERRMSPICRQFTLEILLTNQRRLLE